MNSEGSRPVDVLRLGATGLWQRTDHHRPEPNRSGALALQVCRKLNRLHCTSALLKAFMYIYVLPVPALSRDGEMLTAMGRQALLAHWAQELG